MESPVLLHSSKMVVDDSTLVHLLLVSPSDPFTRCPLDIGSYSRLPNLQADIAAWRNTTSGILPTSTEEDGENAKEVIENAAYETENSTNMSENITDMTQSTTVISSSPTDRERCPLCILLFQFRYI